MTALQNTHHNSVVSESFVHKSVVLLYIVVDFVKYYCLCIIVIRQSHIYMCCSERRYQGLLDLFAIGDLMCVSFVCTNEAIVEVTPEFVC